MGVNMDNYLASLEKLSHLIKDDKKRNKLKEIEDEIFQNEETLKLINAFQKAQEDYNFFLSHFPNDKDKLSKYKDILIDKKREMDKHPLIKAYNDLYLKISEPTLYLETELQKIIDVGDKKIC